MREVGDLVEIDPGAAGGFHAVIGEYDQVDGQVQGVEAGD